MLSFFIKVGLCYYLLLSHITALTISENGLVSYYEGELLPIIQKSVFLKFHKVVHFSHMEDENVIAV